MKAGFPRLLARCALASAILAINSCNEDRSAEIEQLDKELEIARDDLRMQRELTQRAEERARESRTEITDLKSRLRAAERQFRDAERDLERYRRKEELARREDEKEPSSREMRAAAKKTVGEFRDRLVMISGDAGQGTGLLLASEGKNWIYCDRQIIEGNTKLEMNTRGGVPLKRFGSFEISPGSRVVRLEVLEENLETIPLDQADGTLDSSTPLLAFDASGGLVEGRCYGAGEGGTLRIDPRIGDCGTGAAVFHGETGKLVGMLVPEAGQQPSLWPDRNNLRRETTAVSPLGNTSEWSAIPIGTFLKEAHTLAETDELTRLMHAFAASRADASGVTYDSLPGGILAEELLGRHKADPSVRALTDLDSWLRENAARSSQADIRREISGAYNQIDTRARRQTKELRDTRFSPAHAEAAARSLEWREEARKELDRRLEAQQ